MPIGFYGYPHSVATALSFYLDGYGSISTDHWLWFFDGGPPFFQSFNGLDLIGCEFDLLHWFFLFLELVKRARGIRSRVPAPRIMCSFHIWPVVYPSRARERLRKLSRGKLPRLFWCELAPLLLSIVPRVVGP